MLINGRERQVLDQELQNGDTIGLKLDSDKGLLSFDINDEDTGIAY